MGRVSKFSDYKREAIRKQQVLLSYCNTLGDGCCHFDGIMVSPELFARLPLINQVMVD